MLTLRHPSSNETLASFSNASFGGGTGSTRNFNYQNPAETPRRRMRARMPGMPTTPEVPALVPDTEIGTRTPHPIAEAVEGFGEGSDDQAVDQQALNEAHLLGMSEGRPGGIPPAASGLGGMTAPGAMTPMTLPMGE